MNLSHSAMKKKRKRLKESVHISSVLDNILNTYRQESDSGLSRVWRFWDDAVGKTIAENAQPAAFKGKVLLVHVTCSTWIHELRFLEKGIINNINSVSGEHLVEKIKFKIGTL
jgi:predicted nucleic acid-binding Zn ribbon protein